MSDFLAVIQQVGANNLGRLIDRIVNRIVYSDLISTLGGIKLSLFFRDPPIVNDNKIEVNFGSILLNRYEMLSCAVPISLARLRHEIVYEDLCRARATDYPRHLRD